MYQSISRISKHHWYKQGNHSEFLNARFYLYVSFLGSMEVIEVLGLYLENFWLHALLCIFFRFSYHVTCHLRHISKLVDFCSCNAALDFKCNCSVLQVTKYGYYAFHSHSGIYFLFVSRVWEKATSISTYLFT